MPFYDYLKSFLGIPTYKNNNPNEDRSNNEACRNRRLFEGARDEDFENMWGQENRDSDERHFDIHTNPLELHKYFEYQMNEILKSFDGLFGNDHRSFFGFDSNIPQLMPPESDIPHKPSNPRDELLKPGYKKAKSYADSNKSKFDSDVDGKVNLDDLDIMLKEKPSQDFEKYDRQISIPQMRTFGQSITSKTTRGPDGTIETHRTVRDSEGNEETTITRKIGDKTYSVITRTDKDGRQEKIEDMINIDEQELSKFTKNWPQINPQPNMRSDFSHFLPFDKFFKW